MIFICTVALVPMNHFAQKLTEQSISLRRGRPEILQVNVGKLCNLDLRALPRECRAETKGNHDAGDN